ncbi:hypothetical protein [Ferrimonas sp. YFM]|uniref:hypothetical protein n=1 Tax=Ferrimonas sp. YFM TaxID=3028878 RepID=UPI00257423FB|nr:hypothetical protein [Ferrimonas sp. YFM]BDY05855.1 hypothetical protein F0521_28960 [Ferrimonas sp. YFM]
MTELTVLGNPASMEFVKLAFLAGLPLLAYLIYDIVSLDRQPRLWQTQTQKNRP